MSTQISQEKCVSASNLPAIDQGAAILQQLAEISNNVNTRFTAIENRFTALETRFTALENTLTTLGNRSDTHLTAIENSLRTK